MIPAHVYYTIMCTYIEKKAWCIVIDAYPNYHMNFRLTEYQVFINNLFPNCNTQKSLSSYGVLLGNILDKFDHFIMEAQYMEQLVTESAPFCIWVYNLHPCYWSTVV